MSRSEEELIAALTKVITLMTAGYDMSIAFPEMILLFEHKQLNVKKMLYRFVSFYYSSQSSQQSDILMCLNSIYKDIKKDDFKVRRLAVQTLGNISTDDAFS